jgi:hypothetical protein
MMKFKVIGSEHLVVPDVYQGERRINPLDNFKWSSGANVQATWRKYEWVPPTEYREDYLFPRSRKTN